MIRRVGSQLAATWKGEDTRRREPRKRCNICEFLGSKRYIGKQRRSGDARDSYSECSYYIEGWGWLCLMVKIARHSWSDFIASDESKMGD